MGFQKLNFRDFDNRRDIIYGIQPDRTSFVFNHLKLKPPQLRRKDIPLFIDAYDDLNAPGIKNTDHLVSIRDQHRDAVLKAYPEASPGLFKLNTNAYDRKKSKGSLYWAAQNGIHVHFVMHMLATVESQRMVAGKTSKFGGTVSSGDVPAGSAVESRFSFGENDYTDEYKNKSRNVTGSELRWIYRMRGNVLVRTYVQFWKSEDGKMFEQCMPPWDWGDPYDAIWSGYAPQREGFYNSLLSPGSV
ncbi:hypothetical protein ABQ179_001445 [Xanthomonas dyei]|uniref:hypothetical protein n=1 Tax=Xanthomonas dyei TaxID=743699 RepID=UPI0032E8F7B6